MTTFRSQGADPAELDPDRAEIREPAEGVAGDHERPVEQLLAELPELPEGDQLVEHRARAEQPADGAAIFPGHPHHVGDGGEDPAEDRLERRVELVQAEIDELDY